MARLSWRSVGIWGATFVVAGAAVAACSASADDDRRVRADDDDDGGTSGVGGDDSTGSGIDLTGGVGGGSTVCTDVGCIDAGVQGGCDQGINVAAADPMDGARAMGLCADVATAGWGVTDARWVKADGSPLDGAQLALGHGVLPSFGPNVLPQEGGTMLALSSGTARQPADAGYEPVSGYPKDPFPHVSPPGYPKESPSCPGVITGDPYDSAGLELRIKTPINAKSLRFNLNFYTYEFPIYICDTYNDFFVALMTPKPVDLPDGNISFDGLGNTISVNAGFLEVCLPQTAGGKNFPCALGAAELSGTGFEGAAATSWLETTAPVENPGEEITLRFTIWDSGDGVLDSTTLLDNFRFDAEEGTSGTIPVPR
ncbi:MAG: choice-of-anchor L domain-containing protein [Myxococcota bacterium]